MAPSLRFQGVISYLLLCVALPLVSFYAMYTTSSCSVTADDSTNGFYKGVAGVYLHTGAQRSYFPDLYELIRDRTSYSGMGIARDRDDRWEILSFASGELYYFTDREADSDSHPMNGGMWLTSNSTKGSSPLISSSCNGDVRKTIKKKREGSQNSNLQQMLAQPVTMLIILLLCYAAYYINVYRIGVTEVSFSYDSVWSREEYYRCVTAAFAHFDLLHLGFNTMSLYQLGGLEGVFGSFAVAYLSLDLVFITSFIMVLMYHVAIMRYGRISYTNQHGVGYSCVLFAWVVVAAVKLDKYCPLFFIPDICFGTFYLPMQKFGLQPLPMNIGPIILLVFTKIIIPQSSFSGHLAGVIIGFPLAWNMLNWMTVQQLAAVLCVGYIARNRERLLLWKLPGFDITGAGSFGEVESMEGFVPSQQLRRFVTLRRLSYCVHACNVCVVLCGGFWSGLAQAFPRVVTVFFVYSAVHARRHLWLTDARPTQDSCVRLMLLALALVALSPLHDLSLAWGAVAAWRMVVSNGCSPLLAALSISALLAASVAHILFALVLLMTVHEQRSASVDGMLRMILCDKDSSQSDLKVLRELLSCGGVCKADFSGARSALPVQITANPLHAVDEEGGVQLTGAARGGYANVATSDSDAAVSEKGSLSTIVI